MSKVVLSGLTKIFAREPALAEVNLEINSGELLVVLGPNGSGKTTLLRLIAGLESPTRGNVTIGEREVTHVPPHQRSVGLVFQDAALEPDWTVRQQLAFPLSVNRNVAGGDKAARIEALAVELGIEDWLDRRVGELSGGEQRRVAIGRSLIREPAVLLLDEPFANLDPIGRWELRRQLRTWIKARGTTALHVTHDAVEAQWLADRLAVLDCGRLLQVASPAEMYRQPASLKVLQAPATWPVNTATSPGSELVMAVTAEHVGLTAFYESSPWPAATVVQGSQIGSRQLVEFRWPLLHGRVVTWWSVLANDKPAPAPGEQVGVVIDRECLHYFEAATGRWVSAERGEGWLTRERDNGKGGES